jgi:hypothetical protein
MANVGQSQITPTNKFAALLKDHTKIRQGTELKQKKAPNGRLGARESALCARVEREKPTHNG